MRLLICFISVGLQASSGGSGGGMGKLLKIMRSSFEGQVENDWGVEGLISAKF